MATVDVKTGLVTESHLPAHITEKIIKDRIAQEAVKSEIDSDIELLRNSKNPDIQALCRVLKLHERS